MGFAENNIHMKGLSGAEIYDAMGVKGNDADMGVNMGWCSDYPDPYDWINILLYGGAIQPTNNVNYSYMNVPKWNKKMETAAKLMGHEAAHDLRQARPRHHEAGCTDGCRAHVQQPLPLLQPSQSEEPYLPGHLSGLRASRQWH